MTMILRALTDSGSTAVLLSMGSVSSAFLLLVHLVLGMASPGTKVMFFSFICLGVLWPSQGFLVGKRRCSGHWLVQYGAMAAYFLPTLLTFYAVSAVCSACPDESFPLPIGIAVFLLAVDLLSSLISSGMSAYSLRDGPKNRYRFPLSVVYLGYVDWTWTWNSSVHTGLVQQVVMSPYLEWARNNRGLLPQLFQMSLYIGLAIEFLYFAITPSESTMDYETKAVAEYMKRESTSSSPFFDDGCSLQLDCCRYPFTQRRKDGQWISIKDVFHQCRDLPSRDKDNCLSYSLSRLLARRRYGFHCTEEGDDKVRQLALAGLATTDGYKREFSIVEVQCALLYDYFFTTYFGITESSFRMLPKKIQWMSVMALVLCTLGFAMLVSAVAEHNDWLPPKAPETTYRQYLFIVAMVICDACWIIMTWEQRRLPNYWRSIHNVFHKLDLIHPPTTRWVRFLARIYHYSPKELDVYRLLQSQTSTDYWRDEIGQYSLLLDYDRRRSPKKALIDCFLGLVRPQPRYKFIKHLPVEEKDIRVPDSVRKLVADTLWAIDGPPTNGTRSLKMNMDSSVYDWSWTCRQESHTSTILIWHIATCYCDMSRCHSDQPDEDSPLVVETNTFYEVATALSRYCAYLVAFLPEFLPEHNLITKEVFQNTIQDAQGALGSTHSEEKEKLTKIQKLELPPQDCQTIFHKGVRLGRQLEELDARLRWKVMAEFWAETILYVAPSDNAEAHIEHLAKGGEFITHLWAMLSNAGILKRATEEWHQSPASTTTDGPTTRQLTEALSSSNVDEAITSSMSYPQIQTSEAPTNVKGNQPQIL